MSTPVHARSDSAALPRLSRRTSGARPTAPVRIVHLGLGNFFRAHQAWYTDRSPDAAGWGIAAFTGRSASLADALGPQDGLYTLVTRGAGGDGYKVLSSLSAVHAASDQAAWLRYLRSPQVVVITLTVTETGYCRRARGGLDTDRDDIRADLEALRTGPTALVTTAPARLMAGLLARRDAGSGALAVVPCDNLPGNGAAAEGVVLDLAALVDPSLSDWIREHVSFVTTMVDRITPRTTDEDRAAVAAATGLRDAAPVVTEPFAEWVLSGEFPAGRPAWDEAGARFVDDIAPFEERKLWLLNGVHSLLAYAGSLRGHQTVAEAMADPQCRVWVEEWWDDATRHLRLPVDEVTAYRAALLDRFTNPNIHHLLAQIASDGTQKLPVRIAPALRAERASGRLPGGAVRVLAAWALHLRGEGAPVADAGARALTGMAERSPDDAAQQVVSFVVPDLAGDSALVAAVHTEMTRLRP